MDVVEPTLVSIVIPTYNRAPWLARTIQSALDQTYASVEIVIVDDASSDETAVVVSRFADTRLRYHRHAKQVGMVYNHESGLQLARGEFVVFLADDDQMLATFVEHRMGYFERSNSAIVVFSGYQVCDDELRPIGRMEPRFRPGETLASRSLLDAALRRDWLINSSLYRRSALVAAWPRIARGGFAFDTGLHLHLALLELGPGIYGPWCDLVYTHHRGQISRGDGRLAHFDAGIRMYDDVLAFDIPGWARSLVRRDLAAWRTNYGRILAAEGRLSAARRQFFLAVRTDPGFRGGWTQLAMSVIAPARVASTN